MAPLAVPIVLVAVDWLVEGGRNWLVDEAYTAAESQLPLSELLIVFWHRELNGSLHTALMWVMHHVVSGSAPWAYRLSSAVFYLAGCLVMARMLWHRLGPVAAWTGVSVLASSSVLLRQSVNGRTYPLTVLLVLGTFWLAWRLSERPSAGRAVAWGAVAGTTVYAHFFAAPVLLVQFLWLFRRLHPRREWWVAGATAALVTLPVAAFFLAGGGDAGQLPVAPQENWHDLVAGTLALLLEGADGQRILQAAAVVGSLALTGRALRGPMCKVALLAASSVVAVVSLGAAATRIYPGIFNASHLIAAVPPLALLCALGAHGGSRRRLAFVALVVGAALLADGTRLVPVHRQGAYARDGWRSAADYVALHGAHGDLVTTMVPYEGLTAGYYVRRRGDDFWPSQPKDARSLLQQSAYDDRTCLPTPAPGHTLWLMSTQSPLLDQHLPAAARCAGLEEIARRNVSFVTLIEFIHVGTG